jgi:2-dehydropantoate 2-reductase
MKIMVFGLGSIGGYLACVLLKYFPNEVTLIAHNKRKEILVKQGLIMHSVLMGEKTFYCKNIIETPALSGQQDIIFVVVKNYSLKEALTLIRPCVSNRTIIVPVLNGIDHGKIARDTIQNGYVIDSLIYLGARYNSDYSYTQHTNHGKLIIGSPWKEKNEIVKKIIGHPELDCVISQDIKSDLWKKYIKNCAYNTITAYYKCTKKDILASPTRMQYLRKLLNEAICVGIADGAILPKNFEKSTIEELFNQKNLDATSSMAMDVLNGKPTEIETFGGFLTRLAKNYKINTPISSKFYIEMKQNGL